MAPCVPDLVGGVEDHEVEISLLQVVARRQTRLPTADDDHVVAVS